MLEEASATPVSRATGSDTFSRWTGYVTLAAIALVIVVDLWWGLTVENYSWLSDTISDLAAGRSSATYDWAIVTFAAAIALVAIALFRWNLSDWKGDVGPLLGAILAVLVYFIASYDAYGDGDSPSGAIWIHYGLAASFAIGFAAMCFLMKPAFEEVSENWAQASLVIAVLWCVLVPVFWFFPTGWDGLVERSLGLLLMAWHALAAIYLIRHGRGGL